jgi:acetyl esterase/lipase
LSTGTSDSTYTVQNRTIAVEDGEIAIRTITPTPLAGEDPEYPVLVFFHGGGPIPYQMISRWR